MELILHIPKQTNELGERSADVETNILANLKLIWTKTVGIPREHPPMPSQLLVIST